MEYAGFEAWLDRLFSRETPDGVVALSFNLYEGADVGSWSAELIGTSEFDSESDGWASSEVFTARDCVLDWEEASDLLRIQSRLRDYALRYLREGRYGARMKAYRAVALGFVTGELLLLHRSEP